MKETASYLHILHLIKWIKCKTSENVNNSFNYNMKTAFIVPNTGNFTNNCVRRFEVSLTYAMLKYCDFVCMFLQIHWPLL